MYLGDHGLLIHSNVKERIGQLSIKYIFVVLSWDFIDKKKFWESSMTLLTVLASVQYYLIIGEIN